MIPEILNIPVPNWIKVPSDYAGFKQEISQSNVQREKLEAYLKTTLSKNLDDPESDIDFDATVPQIDMLDSAAADLVDRCVLDKNLNFVNNNEKKVDFNKNPQSNTINDGIVT